jgi:hypothetical protein
MTIQSLRGELNDFDGATNAVQPRQDAAAGHGVGNQRVEPIGPEALESAKLDAIVDTAWERSQIRAQQLRQIKQLVVAGDKEGTFQAMQAFFHVNNPVLKLKKSN